MPTSLPTELVIAIIVEAAELFVADDRATVLSLAIAGRYIFTLVRPILLRRVFITDANHLQVNDVLANRQAGALVLDLNIASNLWKATPEAVNCLKNLSCIRGISDTIEIFISLLPVLDRAPLRDVQLWDEALIQDMPVTVTHVCLYAGELHDPPLDYMVSWLRSMSSITHIGVEIVSRRDNPINLAPEDLARGLATVLVSGGLRLQRIAVRVCGELSNDRPWELLLAVLKSWSSTSEMVAMQADRRVALWRDRRIFEDWKDDVQAGIDDPLAGTDIWASASLLAEW